MFMIPQRHETQKNRRNWETRCSKDEMASAASTKRERRRAQKPTFNVQKKSYDANVVKNVNIIKDAREKKRELGGSGSRSIRTRAEKKG